MPSPPTVEQCEAVMRLLGLPTLPEGLRPPHYLESCRNLHALFVRTLNGDAEAERQIEMLKGAFGND